MDKYNITFIAGPTASGKSQLALEIAAKQPSVIINADSMQVYEDLHILTARPSEADMSQVPHALYGFVDGNQAFSVGQWLDHVRDLLVSENIQQRRIIFVGGTGLYFRALGGGLSTMPDIPDVIRHYWRERLANEGAAQLHIELAAHDPIMAQRLQPSDGQRISRALEIWQATGKSLEFWQAQKSSPLVDMTKAKKILILPEREKLYNRINTRLDTMIDAGALEEVQALLNRQLDAQLPVMKAIGVRELGGILSGVMDQNQALMLAKQQTRHYAKRQLSWFRNQTKGENWQIFPDTGSWSIGRDF